jgi:hypothetical protein
MRQGKAIILTGFAISFLMLLFPPWNIRQRNLDSETYGPENSGGYAFIANPPYVNNGIDVSRLIVQLAAVALATVFCSIVTGIARERGWRTVNREGTRFQRNFPTLHWIIHRRS